MIRKQKEYNEPQLITDDMIKKFLLACTPYIHCFTQKPVEPEYRRNSRRLNRSRKRPNPPAHGAGTADFPFDPATNQKPESKRLAAASFAQFVAPPYRIFSLSSLKCRRESPKKQHGRFPFGDAHRRPCEDGKTNAPANDQSSARATATRNSLPLYTTVDRSAGPTLGTRFP